MLLLVLLLTASFVLTMAGMSYLLGFRLGQESNAVTLLRVREQGLLAERAILRTSRDAFRAIVEHVENVRRFE